MAGPEGDQLQVGAAFDQPDATDDVFGTILLDGPAADVEVGGGHRVHHLPEGDAILLELEGRDLDLVLADEAADAGHLRHAGDGGELIADIGVLQGAQGAQVLLAGIVLEVVLIDPAQAGGIRAQTRHHPRGQQVAQGIEALQDPGAGEIDVDVVLEDDGEEGEAEHGGGAHRSHPGQALEGDGEGVGDLVLHLLGRAPGPVGIDDDLVFRQVRDGVDGHPLHGHQPPGAEGEEAAEHQEAVMQGPADEAIDHGWPALLSVIS